MAPRSVLIIGGNRGIGLGIVKNFVENKDIKILIVTSRNPAEAKELNEINDPRLHNIPMEVTCDDSIRKAFTLVQEIVGDEGLNLLVYNSGVFVKYFLNPEKVDRSILQNTINVNSISPVIVTQIFLPLLQKAVKFTKSDSFSADNAAVVVISSDMGSQQLNQGNGDWGGFVYRMSKCAGVSFIKSMCYDLVDEKILFVSLHPGWVQTDMGGPNATITIMESGKDLVNSMLILGKEHNGNLYTRTLEPMPF